MTRCNCVPILHKGPYKRFVLSAHRVGTRSPLDRSPCMFHARSNDFSISKPLFTCSLCKEIHMSVGLRIQTINFAFGAYCNMLGTATVDRRYPVVASPTATSIFVAALKRPSYSCNLRRL